MNFMGEVEPPLGVAPSTSRLRNGRSAVRALRASGGPVSSRSGLLEAVPRPALSTPGPSGSCVEDGEVEQLRGVAPPWSALATRCLTGRPQLHEMVGTTGFAPAASASPRQRSPPELRPDDGRRPGCRPQPPGFKAQGPGRRRVDGSGLNGGLRSRGLPVPNRALYWPELRPDGFEGPHRYGWATRLLLRGEPPPNPL